MRIWVLVLTVALVLLGFDAFALKVRPAAVGEAYASSAPQDAGRVPEGLINSVRSTAGAPSESSAQRMSWLTDIEFASSSSVLLFGIIVFFAELLVIKVGNYSAEQSTKLLAITLIIIATLFIITAGFSSVQIAPAMGLFGTVAGYLLGRSQADGNTKKDSP